MFNSSEMADPVPSPYYTDKMIMDSTPHEIKLKEMIDKGFSEDEINGMIDTNKIYYDRRLNDEKTQGTTPRKCINLITSLADLISGSGDRKTPVVYIQNYF